MSYATKYQIIFENIRGEIISAELQPPNYTGPIIQLVASGEQPITIQRQSDNDALFGVFGTAAKIRLINNGTFDVAEFVADNYTDWKCNIHRNAQILFTGWMVVDDITNERRVTPYEVELTFSDNLALLSDIEAPFQIEAQFTPLIEVVKSCLTPTGLPLPINVFFLPHPDTESGGNGTFEVTQLIPRSFAKSLTEFEKARKVLNDILVPLRCRLFQQGGEWVILRITDVLYLQADFEGWQYDFDTLTPTAATLSGDLISSLLPLRFSQTVTHKRARRQVRTRYNYNPGFQFLNADLQLLGNQVSQSTTGDITTTLYEVPLLYQINAQVAYIRVEYNDVLEFEVGRYLQLELNTDIITNIGTAYLRAFPILVSKGDKFNFRCQFAATLNTNSAVGFGVAFLFIPKDGGNARRLQWSPTATPGNRRLIWNTIPTATIDNMTAMLIKRQEGSFTNQDFDGFDVLGDFDNNDLGMPPFPADGQLYIAFFSGRPIGTAQAGRTWLIKDIQFEYEYYVSDSILIEAQQHTAFSTTETLSEDEQQISVDDSSKYNSIGALYDSNDDNTRFWDAGGSDTVAYGELAVREQMAFEGDARQLISGEFEGLGDFGNLYGFEGDVFIPTRLTIDLQRRILAGDWLQVAGKPQGEIDYNFKYLYKKEK